MVETVLLGGVAGLVVAIIVSLIVLQIQRHSLHKTSLQRQGWEKAQEARQQQWQLQQEKRALSLEKNLSHNVQEVQHEWQEWEQRGEQREQALKQQYQELTHRTTIESIVKRLPSLEEASLPSPENRRRRESIASAAPAQLQNVDLSNYDLSRKYLGNANLRGANLSHANLFMSDLSGACLAGADLSSADLSGTNLVNADFRGANLSGVNLLVADMNDAILLKANLHNVKNFTPEQLGTTVHDMPTQHDAYETRGIQFEEEGVTQPRLPALSRLIMPSANTDTQLPSVAYNIVQAQSLDALPETFPVAKQEESSPSSLSSPSTQSPTFDFAASLPETSFQLEDETPDTPLQEDEKSVTATSIPNWTSEQAQETLRLLEGLQFSSHQYSDTEDFDSSTQESKRDQIPQMRAS